MKISGNPRLAIIQNGSTIESTNVTIIKTEVTTVRSPEGGVSETYQQRKGMLSEYQELFKALWRLPDKEVQQKVLRCINAKYRSVETQTDPVEILEIKPKIQKHDAVEDKLIVNTNNQESTSPNDTCSEPSKPPTPKKRKRKRKVSVPQVNKESRVAVTHKRQMAKMRQQNQHEKESGRETVHIRNGGEMKRSRLDSDMSDASFLSGMMGDDLDLQLGMRCKEKLFQTIVKDTILADVPLENGLLPIHDSIVRKQLPNLNIQIFIWKEHKRVDLNELITDDDEDLLQLAINNNCGPDIINLLLTKGVNANTIDSQGNTVIHLSVLNDIDTTSLYHLMTHIDMKLLLALNNDGYTALQIAIRQDCYLLAECILNAMDKRLSGDVFYKRDYNILETDEKIIKTNFKNYYENVCLQMEADDDDDRSIIRNDDLMVKLLQAPDMRSGNTALFFAIENQSEHLIYFLLAHLTDPRTENLSGQDCKTFFNEFGKTLNLSLNIDNMLEKVIKLLS